MTMMERKGEEAFIERLEEELDAGEWAMLRRGCGERDPVEGRCPWLVGLIRGAAPEPAAFLAASLMAQFKTVDIMAGRHRAVGNFGATWKRAILVGNENQKGIDGEGISRSIKRRFNVLLDAEYDPWRGDGDLPYRLRQMVKYAVSRGIGVDWPQLLGDLRFWNLADKRAQKRWAHDFFSHEGSEDAAPTKQGKE